MKKSLTIGITVLAAISLVGCGNNSSKKSSASSSVEKKANPYKFKNGTLTSPDETIKIDSIATTDPSSTDGSNGGKVAVIKYEYTNKRSGKYKPETSLLDRFTIEQVNGKKHKNMSGTVGSVATTQYDELHTVGTTKVAKGKKVTAVAFVALPNAKWDHLKLIANDDKQNSVGSKVYKLDLETVASSSSAATKDSTSQQTATSSNSGQADPSDDSTWNLPYKGYSSYNAYLEANNGDPDVQKETADLQEQWLEQQGLANSDGSPTQKSQDAGYASDGSWN